MTRLERSARLRERRDYVRVQRTASRSQSRHFILLTAKRPKFLESVEGPRLGITASKKVGNAVARNRIKRRLRAWFREVREDVVDRDFVVIARRGAPELSYPELVAQLSELLPQRAARENDRS